MTIDIEKMTIKEKLRAMEILWDDICRKTPNFDSPEWHEQILKAREERLKEGKEKIIDWYQAKDDIRKTIQ